MAKKVKSRARKSAPAKKAAQRKPARKKTAQPPSPPVTPVRDKTSSRLLDAIDLMQDMAPGSIVSVVNAPQPQGSQSWRVPWRLAARFVMPTGTSYDDIYEIVREWRDSRKLEREIGSDRLTRMVIRYRDKEGRGGHGEYTLSGIGSWELTASRATEVVGVRDGRLESLVERYGSGISKPSYIESIVVWFSPWTTKEIKVGKEKGKGKAKTKSRRRV